ARYGPPCPTRRSSDLTCNITFSSAGGRTVTAGYAGDGNFAVSTSAGVTHTVGAASTTTTITADTPAPSVVGQPVTVTYTVTSAGVGRTRVGTAVAVAA